MGLAKLPVFTSAINIFVYVKNAIKRCTALTTAATFFTLAKEFKVCVSWRGVCVGGWWVGGWVCVSASTSLTRSTHAPLDKTNRTTTLTPPVPLSLSILPHMQSCHQSSTHTLLTPLIPVSLSIL